jgi:hypothetical protein
MNRTVAAIVLVLISMASSACGATATPYADTQISGSLSATLLVLPFPPVPMESTTLDLTLRDADQQPVSGASVSFDLTMPAMEMPVNRPQASEAEPGVYRANAVFTMAGEWRIQAEVSYKGRDEEFVFPLHTR